MEIEPSPGWQLPNMLEAKAVSGRNLLAGRGRRPLLFGSPDELIPARHRLEVSLHKSKRSVFIENPPEGGSRWTNRRQARRLVERGGAEWADQEQRVLRIVRIERQATAPANSPRLEIIARNAWSLDYRNQVLGLPNFVGIQPRSGTPGRKLKAA
jgi:hypothetical protein